MRGVVTVTFVQIYSQVAFWGVQSSWKHFFYGQLTSGHKIQRLNAVIVASFGSGNVSLASVSNDGCAKCIQMHFKML